MDFERHGINTMKNLLTLCCVFITWPLVAIQAFEDPYSAQPRIITENGHMIFMTSENHNISFRCKGSGKIRINDEDLTELVDKTKRNVQQLENFRDNEITEIRQQINNLRENENIEALNRRLTQVENSITTLSAQVSAVTNATRGEQNVRIRNLINRVNAIQRLLGADECQSNPCQNGGTCEDGYNKFICRCPPNWQGALCNADVNECAQFAGTAQGCQNGATCVNALGTYHCTCGTGWYGVHCTERQDVCSESSNAALCGHGTCINRPTNQAGQPHYTCLCEQGWQTDGRNPACDIDINECQSPQPPCSHSPRVECINVPGTFYCGACPAGYSGNGYVCADIDECLVNNGGCSTSPMTTCFNTLGSRRCGPCPPGYQGDGVFCMYLGVCAFDNGGCHPLATCIENPRISNAYRECRCLPGYVGIGIGITGCVRGTDTSTPTDTSILQSNPCQNQPCIRGTCVAIGQYSFRCNCPQGYAGQLCDIDSDECLSFPCQNGGTCQDQPGGFRCVCPSMFTGVVCENQVEACGAYLNSENGSFRYPAVQGSPYPHDRSCAWVITTTWGKVINATFPEFHLEFSQRCNYDFLQVNDGSSASDHPIGKYCGTTPPRNGYIISNHNQLYLWFRSDASHATDGFRVNWTSINPICGGELNETEYGTIASPGYPGKYPHDRDCVWTIRVPLGKRIKFQFATLQLENHPNCSYDFLQLSDGLRENDAVLQTYCSTVTPPPIETSGSFARLYFHSDQSQSDYGFHITYSSIPGVHGCGGLLTQAKGAFSSPAYPNHYSHNLECDWRIRAKPRERIRFKFLSIDIESHPNCAFDYVELRDGRDSEAPFVGKYCSTIVPPVHVSTGNNLFIRFRTDYSLSRPGFNAEYEIVCGGVYEETSGIVQSPNYPEPYPISRECTYIIRQPVGKAIWLQFQGFDIEGSNSDLGSNCRYDYLEVHDGDSENSPLLNTLCGTDIPDDILSTHNMIWMKFKTDATVSNRGFLANYSTFDVACGGILTSPSGRISSPSHPEEYIHGANCRWIIRGRSGHTIRLTFLTFVLESSSTCQYDYVAVYDNVIAPTDVSRIGRYCGGVIPPVITSTDSTLLVVFKSDTSVSREGFSAEYTIINSSTACGGEYSTQVGIIKSPNYPNNYPHGKQCDWTISVPTGQQIMLNVTDFRLESHRNCDYDYLEIRNGGHMTSPLIGKYCAQSIPQQIPTHGHQVWIRFSSDSSNSAKGFQISWDGTVTGCGGRLTAASGSFASPNYPSSCSSGATCEWEIVVSRGNFIRIIFIDWHHSPQCNNDGLQVWSSSGFLQSKVGHYCGDLVPEPVTITTNKAVVKFRCPRRNNYRGFHLTYNTDCNIDLSGRRGIIESPNYPDPYPANRNCTWQIHAPRGNTLNLTFSAGHLEESRNGNCRFDYIEITDLLQDTGNPLARFCGPVDLSKMVSTNSSYVSVQFVTDYSVQSTGFHMEWTAVGCGGDLNKPEGTITSPNYPSPNSISVMCEWHITVDIGSSVEFTIQNYDLFNHAACYSNNIKVIGGPDTQYPELVNLCTTVPSPRTITSSGNHLLVQYKSGPTSRGQGFRATYRTIHSGCGGNFTTNNGVIHSKNFPGNYGANDECTWIIFLEVGHSVVLNFTDFDVQPGSNCSAAYVAVYDGPEVNQQLMVQHCGNTLPSPSAYKSRSNIMVIKMKADGTTAAKGFHAEYTTGCGSEIFVNEVGEITSPNYPHVFQTGILNCTWIIRAVIPGDRISLAFTSLDYGTSSDYLCTNNRKFIEIYDGEDQNGTRLHRICNSKIPPAFFSSSSAISVFAYASYSAIKFRAIYREASTGCGGDFHALHGMFTSPGFPESYELFEECVWTIYVGPGNKATLTFRSFNLEESEYCNSDYVEIRESSAMGSLLGRFCGQQILMNSTLEAFEKLWVKFSSNGAGTARGFQAEFNIATNVELSGTYGEISNPLHTLTQQLSESYTYKITVPMYKHVQITFTEFRVGSMWASHFRIFDSNDGCSPFYGKMQIYDGIAEDSPLLKTLCGTDIPDPIISTNNELMIQLITKSYSPSQFLLQWSAVDYTPPWEGEHETERKCVHEISVTMENSTTIQIPTNISHLDDYASYQKSCEWIFRSPIATRLQVYFPLYNIRESGCYSNKVELFDGSLQTGRWTSLKSLCSQEDFHSHELMFSGGNIMKINVSFTPYYDAPTFKASVSAVCGGNVSDQTAGSIQSAMHPAEYLGNQNCDWLIRVRPGKTIRIRIADFDINSSPPTCREDYLVLRNGASVTSPPLGNGKYCGQVVPQIPDTTGNHLYVQFKSDFSGSGRGFSLVYEEKGADCGGRRTLGGAIETAVISSPNYPSSYPPHTECDWVIIGSAAHRVRLEFNDHFDIPFSIDCANDYVEIRNGGTMQSPVMSRFCGHDLPSVVMSSANMMFVRFFSNANNPSIGFKATAKLAVCGGTIASNRETVSSPNYPSRYTGKVDCEWTIRGPIGHYMTLTFNAIQLPDAVDCSTTDYVEIRDLNSTGQLLGRFCGNTIPQPVASADNLVYVRFVTTGSQSMTGFQLAFEASVEVCGGELNSPMGVITSPNYPGLYPSHRTCMWIIRVDPSRSIRLQFTRFDISTQVAVPGMHWCTDSVTVLNGDRTAARYMPYLLASDASCGTELPAPIESTSNTMTIIFTSDMSNSGTGFRAEYSSDNEALCGGILPFPSGYFTTPGFHTAELYPNNLNCHWKLTNPIRANSSISFSIEEFSLEGMISTRACLYDRLHIYDEVIQSASMEFCGNMTPQIIPVPYADLNIHLKTDSSIIHKGFNISYKVQDCGGIIRGQSVLTSPSYPNAYGNDLHCAWAILLPDDQQVHLRFTDLRLEQSTDCINDYVLVRSGPSADSPSLQKYCGNVLPEEIRFHRNEILVEFHTNGQTSGNGFRLEVLPILEGCGGISKHERQKVISSPGFPAKYLPNDECVWEIIVEHGYHINVTFIERFDIQQTSSCQSDYIEISEFIENSYRPVGQHICGLTAPSPIISRSNQMRIMFRTDGNTEGDGFKILWTRGCGGIITDMEGSISSPGFPQNYADNLNCSYILQGDPEHYIRLTFDPQYFSLEDSNDCIYDRIEVYRGNTTDGGLLGKYCGNNIPGPFVSQGSLLLRFITDFSFTTSGFLANYKVTACGGVLTAPTGIVMSPTNPDNYHHYMNCTWVIYGQQDRVIHLRFEAMDLEYSGSCGYDHVSVFDGPNISSRLLGKYCGQREPFSVMSENSTMTVQFRTDSSVAKTGFVATYRQTFGWRNGCGGVLNATSGSISSVDWDKDGNYEPDLDCVWNIMGTSLKHLKLHFESFALENGNCSYDYLEIRDGHASFSPVVDKFCGTRVPSDIILTTNFAWIHFVSDGRENRAGFRMTYTSMDVECQDLLFATNISQSIQSPGYPRHYPMNARCWWVITAPEGEFVDITFTDFDLEESPRCKKDFVIIREMNHNAGDLVFRRCGNVRPPTYRSIHNQINMHFSSDITGTGKGFIFTYHVTTTCNRTYTTPHDFIHASLQWGSTCRILIEAVAGYTITLYTESEYIYHSTDCSNYFKVWDGPTNTSSLLVTHCDGYSYQSAISSSQNKMLLELHGDTQYMSVKALYTTTNQGQGCGGPVHVEHTGIIRSPANLSSNVGEILQCTWTITGKYNYKLELSQEGFSMQPTDNCTVNYLEIYENAIEDTGHRIGRYCNSDIPWKISPNSDTILLKYVITGNSTDNFFSLRINSVSNMYAERSRFDEDYK